MINLAKYAGMKICVAVSGGKDSMALLHYLNMHSKEFGISLTALNCDHKIRGAASASDSEFVKKKCAELKIPLTFFEWECGGERTESAAREWRLGCYRKVIELGADAVATAHHLNDNAETVLFNLARGSGLSGMKGINDVEGIIRPMILCTREQIDRYIADNEIRFVEDESNFTDDYTRNKIRHNVLPELENAVPGAVKAIYRFSRIALEYEEYFDNLVSVNGIVKQTSYGTEISICNEKAVFKHAVLKALNIFKSVFKDYTSAHLESLYNLQFSENGKRFGFLGLVAYKEGNKIVLTESAELCSCEEIAFGNYRGDNYCGRYFKICGTEGENGTKSLRFDLDKIPDTAVIRFMRSGDKFTKFGGGTKNLGDYFTDKKIPLRIRNKIPLITSGNEILAVGGVEISDKIKITENTKNIRFLVCEDFCGSI